MGYPHSKLVGLICTLVGQFLLLTGAADAAMFLGIGDLSGGIFSSQASDVSSDGSTLTGWSEASSGEKALRWSLADGAVPLASLPGDDSTSHAYAVAAAGDYIAGSVGIGGVERAVRWGPGSPTQPVMLLGTLGGGTYSRAYSISADGTMVAGYGNSTGGWQAFRWVQGTGMQGLGWLDGAINLSRAIGISRDGETVVGWSYSGGGFITEACRWTEDSGIMVGLGDLPGGSVYSSAQATSADGSVIVGASKSAAGPEAFIWTDAAEMVGLGDLPGGPFDSEALNVSDDGTLVVGTATDDTGEQAFIWRETVGMQSVQELLNLYEVNTTGWVLQKATAVSQTASGVMIVGTGINPTGNTEGWVAEVPAFPYVPEPLSWSLLACGGFGLFRRRRR